MASQATAQGMLPRTAAGSRAVLDARFPAYCMGCLAEAVRPM